MPKMTLLWLLLYMGAGLFSFVNPIYGLLGYLLEYHLRPRLHWWGAVLPDFRWNLMIALVLGASYVLRSGSLPTLPSVKNPALKWLLALGLLMIPVTLVLAVRPDRSFEFVWRFWTYIVVYLLIIGIVRTRWAFDAFFAACIAGATIWGWNAYVDPARNAGRLAMVGSSDTLNDNLAAGHLLTILPMLMVYLLTKRGIVWRGSSLFALAFIVNLFILCNSRGATLGLGVALVASLALVRSGQRIRWATLAIVTPVVLGVLLADKAFIDRQQTTSRYEQDASATGRLVSWQGAWRLLQDHPFGAGGRGFHELSPIYIAEVVDEHEGELRSPHNTYALVASEWGFLGLALFLGFIGSSWLVCGRVRKLGLEPGDSYFYYRGMALQLGLLGTMTAATFSDRFYGESIYWICAMGIALSRIQAGERAVPLERPVSDAQAA